jgi:hypothetical protein
MKQFSDERFVDIGQTLFISWIRDLPTGIENSTQQENCEQFKMIAQMAFDAAEEFAKVFKGKERHA